MNNYIYIKKETDNFPQVYTIDELGLEAITYFLRQEFAGKEVRITVEEEVEKE